MISIIVPFYNSSKYIKECIDSILNQTYKNFELLLINDGSTDNSLSICKKYKDKKIKIFDCKHKGVSYARNYGLSKAKGKYIYFVDSDDIIHKDFLKTLLSHLKKGIDFVECGFTNTNVFNTFTNNKKTLNKKELLFRMYSKEGIRNNIIVNKLFNKNLFKNIRFENKCHEDEFIIHKIFNITNKAVIINKTLYYYRIHNDSRQRNISKERMEVLEVFDEREKLLSENIFVHLNQCAKLNQIIYLYCVYYKHKKFEYLLDLYKLFLKNYNNTNEYSLKLKIKYNLFKANPKIVCILLLFNRRFKYA